jgi:hypothetical protein
VNLHAERVRAFGEVPHLERRVQRAKLRSPG